MNMYHCDWFNKCQMPRARQDLQGRENSGEKGRVIRKHQDSEVAAWAVQSKDNTHEAEKVSNRNGLI